MGGMLDSDVLIVGAGPTGVTLGLLLAQSDVHTIAVDKASVISTPDGEVTVRGRYMVGADGSRSAVREVVGIEMDDLQFDEEWLVIDTIVHDYERLPAEAVLVRPDRYTFGTGDARALARAWKEEAQ